MKVLVSAATRYGATEEIAMAVAEVLRESGLEVEVARPEQVGSVKPYPAFVLGSAVYAGHWLKPARELVERLRDSLAARPVWLFSSGPVGDPPRPEEDPVDVAGIVKATSAREYRVFAGRIVRKELSFADRAIALALRAPDGDFRDWDAIRRWAEGIASALRVPS